MNIGDAIRVRWGLVSESLARPYRVTVPMIALLALVPFYIFIAHALPPGRMHEPALAIDRMLPLVPAWSVVYGALYMFLIVLPVLVAREDVLIQRALYAYLSVWLTAYAIFIAYPTMAPRPLELLGNSFGVWGLKILYDADPPFNCFPSLHVAHSFVSAFVIARVRRGLGGIATVFAAVVGLSTLLTKQHYVIDVVAGIAMATAARFVFLRNIREESNLSRRAAPWVATALAVAIGVGVVGYWIAYAVRALG